MRRVPKTGRKTPPKRGAPKQRATAQVSNVGSKNKRVIIHEDKAVEVQFPIAGGPAGVEVGNVIKYWGGTENYSGIAVESSVSIQLRCEQSPLAIEHANDAAAEMAHMLMHKNADRVRRDMIVFLDDEEKAKKGRI
jgi:hypothetical protein